MEIKIIPVMEVQVINTVKSFKTKNTSGYKGTSKKILTCCANVISKRFTFICNSSLASGIYPERFMFAIKWPIYKKWDETKMTNYITISLLISFSNISETLLLN
jgi:hypothetical protein